MGSFFESESTEQQDTTSSNQLDMYGPAKGGVDWGIDSVTGLMRDPTLAYDGDTFARFNDQTQNLLGEKSAYGAGVNENFFAPTNAAWQDQLSGVNAKPYTDAFNLFTNETNKNLNEGILPGVRDSFTGSGGTNSSRAALIEGQARGDAADSVARYGADMGLKFAQDSINQRNMAMGNAGAMMNLGLSGTDIGLGVEDLYRQQDQLGISQDMNNYYFNENAPWASTERGLGSLTPLAAQFGESVGESHGTTTSTQSKSPFDAVVGLGSMVAGLYGAGALGGGGGAALGAGGAMNTAGMGALSGYGTSLSSLPPTSWANPGYMPGMR